jgi:hypothetical protein
VATININKLEKEIAEYKATLQSVTAERDRILPTLEKTKYIDLCDISRIRGGYYNNIERLTMEILDAEYALNWERNKSKREGKKQ